MSVPLAVQCINMDEVLGVKMVMGRRGMKFLEDGREWRLHGFLCAVDLVLYGVLEEYLGMMVGWFT